MRKRLFQLTTIGLAALAAPLLSAQKSTTTNVTTIVYDYSGNTLLLTRSDDYNASGCGGNCATYVGGKHNLITSGIDSDGNWGLGLGNQPRTFYVNPGDPVGSEPSAPLPNYYDLLQAHSQCYDQNKNYVPFPSLVNGSNNCQFGIEFHYNGLVYKLAMGPNVPAGGAATGLVSVVCNAVSSNQCVDWTISPNTVAPNPNVANLYWYNGSTATWVFVGQYYNTFLIRVTNP